MAVRFWFGSKLSVLYVVLPSAWKRKIQILKTIAISCRFEVRVTAITIWVFLRFAFFAMWLEPIRLDVAVRVSASSQPSKLCRGFAY